MKIKIIIFGIFVVFLSCNFLFADEVFLKNEDRITGTVVADNEKAVTIETEALGKISIKKEFVERVVADEVKEEARAEEPKSEAVWIREVSLGYSKTSGNTQNSQFNGKLSMHRKTDDNEFHLQGESFYSSANKKMDAQRWNAMTRYAYSFWEREWYHYYKLQVDHDRFANIDYRIIPSTGIGYWFSDTDDFKAMCELGLGAEYTNYRDNTKDETEPVLIPRAFIEKRLIGKSRISEDITMYPSLDNMGEYRLHSETVFTNPINDTLSLKISFIDDYDSDPSAGTKKNDTRFISALAYSF